MTRDKFPYIQLHDAYPEHPKTAARSAEAFRAHISAICYAHRRQTDGFVPLAVAQAFGRKGLRELVQAGMLLEVEGGYQVHDYDQWNETREEIEARRIRNKNAAHSRWDSETDATRMRDASRLQSPPRVDVDALGSGSVGLVVQEPQPRNQVSFDEFWAIYPKRKGKGAARKRWEEAVKKVPAPVLLAATRRYADDPNLPDEEFIPWPQKWLREERWNDDPEPERSNGHHENAADQMMRMALTNMRHEGGQDALPE